MGRRGVRHGSGAAAPLPGGRERRGELRARGPLAPGGSTQPAARTARLLRAGTQRSVEGTCRYQYSSALLRNVCTLFDASCIDSYYSSLTRTVFLCANGLQDPLILESVLRCLIAAFPFVRFDTSFVIPITQKVLVAPI